MGNIAVYAGTFSPFTTGHQYILEQALAMFDHIFLAVGVNPAKKETLSLESRLDMLRDLKYDRVTVTSFDNQYLVDYAFDNGIEFIIRGLRNNSDFEYEFAMAAVNKKINPTVRTAFFMADQEHAPISSSMVMGMIGPKGWQQKVRPYVPEKIWPRFIEEIGKLYK